MTDTVTIKNVKFYYSTYEVNDEDYTFSFVLTNSKGTPQTIDYINVNKDIYVQLGTLNGVGKYNLTNVTRVYEKSNPLNQIRGDVDGDGKVDVSDVNAAINIILEIKPASYYKGNADLTKDGKVDIEDVNAIINIILTQ